ncbi:MAG: hypothetical protein ABIL58_06750 [Pseudomonadota bacterium]
MAIVINTFGLHNGSWWMPEPVSVSSLKNIDPDDEAINGDLRRIEACPPSVFGGMSKGVRTPL